MAMQSNANNFSDRNRRVDFEKLMDRYKEIIKGYYKDCITLLLQKKSLNTHPIVLKWSLSGGNST